MTELFLQIVPDVFGEFQRDQGQGCLEIAESRGVHEPVEVGLPGRKTADVHQTVQKILEPEIIFRVMLKRRDHRAPRCMTCRQAKSAA